MRKGKFSKAEEKYIKSNLNVEVGQLAQDLDRSVESVKKKLEEFSNHKEEVIAPAYKGSAAGQLLGRKVKDGKVICTTMTEAFSERTDDSRPQRVNVSHRTKDAIAKPLGNVKFNNDGTVTRINE